MQKARRHPIGAPTACRRMVSGSLSLRCSRFFSPFPHGTCPLSVSQEYLALPDGPGRFRQGSSCPALLRVLLNKLFVTCTGLSPPSAGFSKTVPLPNNPLYRSPATPVMPKQNRFRLLPFRSPLLRESLLFYFPVGNEMFQFPTFAFHLHGISR